MSDRHTIWEQYYISLWSNGEIGVSDGVGYIGTICSKETRELYEALRKHYGEMEDMFKTYDEAYGDKKNKKKKI